MSEEDIVVRLRKRAEIRAKIDRGDGKVDRKCLHNRRLNEY